MSDFGNFWQVMLPTGPVSAPPLMSPSVLSDIEACPRRYFLRRGDYPQIWDKPGYPRLPSVSSLRGIAIHNSLEAIGREMSGSPVGGEQQFVESMRRLGGFDAVVQRIRDEIIRRTEDNPRTSFKGSWLSEELRRNHALIRQQVQANSRVLGAGNNHERTSEATTQTRAPLPKGCHLEIELRAPELSCKGRLDCLSLGEGSCEIADFKTGEPSDEHEFQLHFYQMLWEYDRERNPAAIPVTKLTLMYPTVDRDVPVMDSQQLSRFAEAVRERSADCALKLAAEPPVAQTSAENCSFCDVRQNCQEYWNQSAEANFIRDWGGKRLALMDVEVELVEPVTSLVWLVQSVGGGLTPGTRAHLRLGGFYDTFQQSEAHAGSKVRITAASFMKQLDENGALLVLDLGPTSEVFFC